MAVTLAASPAPAEALHSRALSEVVAAYGSQPFILRADLRGPAQGGDGMLVPMLDRKGWHFTGGSPVLAAGAAVEVTGLFNYSERGFVVEIARQAEGFGAEPVGRRERVRVRLTVESPSADPAAQVREAAALLRSLLSFQARP
ncbi:MAG TPA: hypothetical protein VJV23_04205 [Candidatus Polarisedimenticolia bacterium]|nr:hypothetical protein [Candidatus Polarisedimenticolia bacterium]